MRRKREPDVERGENERCLVEKVWLLLSGSALGEESGATWDRLDWVAQLCSLLLTFVCPERKAEKFGVCLNMQDYIWWVGFMKGPLLKYRFSVPHCVI